MSFECTKCTAKLATNANLKRHFKSIREGKMRSVCVHTCNLCGAKLAGKSKLSKFIETVHENKKPFECTLGAKKFGYKGHLNTHITSIIKE